jgi:hypothetical protein
LLPQLSRLSVRSRPGSRLRHWRSSRYLRISPLHREFRFPLLPSSPAVSRDVLQLSRRLSHGTDQTAYTRFTPSDSGQRLPPTSYRGCWHVVSRGFLLRYRHLAASSLMTGVYNPKAFIPHAASLGQACAHCPRFPTAASRRSLDRVSVPVWLTTLSGQLPVIALVGRYPTNKLIGRETLLRRLAPFPHQAMRPGERIRY